MQTSVFAGAITGDTNVEIDQQTKRGRVKDFPIFRAGEFADSGGAVEVWSVQQLAQMVQNFHLLRPLFPHVPIRADHGRSVEDIKGYITDLRVEGDILLADFEFTEPDAIQKFARGTYRARSSEVGPYQTNDGSLYFPVLLGVAFVDIPAVEGLYQKSNENNFHFFRETSNVQFPNQMAPGFPQNGQPTASGVPTDWAQMMSQFAAAQGQPTQTITNGTTTFVPAAPAAPAAPESDSVPEAHKFTMNGTETVDMEAVQAHIVALETAANEQRVANRANFVKEMVTGNRVLAPQEEATAAFAQSLTDEQFAEWRKTMEAAPPATVFAKIDGVSNPDGDTGEADALQTELLIAREVVANHKRSGSSEEFIKSTASYGRMVELETQLGGK